MILHMMVITWNCWLALFSSHMPLISCSPALAKQLVCGFYLVWSHSPDHHIHKSQKDLFSADCSMVSAHHSTVLATRRICNGVVPLPRIVSRRNIMSWYSRAFELEMLVDSKRRMRPGSLEQRNWVPTTVVSLQGFFALCLRRWYYGHFFRSVSKEYM